MTVYVDPIIRCRPTPDWPFYGLCRMTADGEMELHEMARRLYVPRDRYHPGRIPYYEITPGIRNRAVAMGAMDLKVSAWFRRKSA